MQLDPCTVRPRKIIPAWLLSSLLHLVVLLAAALLIRATGQPRGLEPERRAAIVLAQPQDDGRTEYVGEREAEMEREGASTDALPSAEETASLAPGELSLPSPKAVPADEGLVAAPEYAAGKKAGVPSGIDVSAVHAEEAARRKKLAARGPPVRISLFGGSEAEGRSFAFLIDRSKSMGSGPLGALEAAEAELIRALEALAPKQRFQVIAYHHKCVYLKSRELLPATDENKEAIRGHLTRLAAFGATEHELALMSALNLKPDVIFLLTDGGEPQLDAGTLRRIHKLAAPATTIHCVHFGYGPRQDTANFLPQLAAQNDGSYRYVDMSGAGSSEK